MHVLVVEDDELVARGLQLGLAMHDMTVDHVDSIARAEAAVSASGFDIGVVDLGLPDGDGLALLSRWRARDLPLPVLILTARDAVDQRVRGLQAGADDYLTKPFDLEELVARLHAIARRSQGRSADVIRHGRLSCSPGTSTVRLDGEDIELPRRELLLLLALLRHPGRIFTSEQLHESVYGFTAPVGSNALNVHLHNLRKKLGAEAILTIRGLGYRMGELS